MRPQDIMIVGQAPSRSSTFPFDSRSGDRLARLLDLDSRHELREKCHVVNLLDTWPGPADSGKGDAFSEHTAREAAKLLHAVRPIVLMCGRSVAAVCDVRVDYFTPVPWRGGVAVVIPHPSGISHWWNDYENQTRAERFFETLLESTPTGLACPRFSGAKLKKIIESRGTTNRSLAEKIKRHEKTVGRWVNGETKPNADELYALTWALSCDTSDLAEL